MTRAPRERGHEPVLANEEGGHVPKVHDPVTILFENDDVLAAAKPEGVLSVSQGSDEATLPDLLRDRFPGKLYPVHRLDRGASGVIVFAKNAEAHRRLNGQFDRREVRKTYLALVDGVPASNRGRINAPLREFGSGRMGVDPKRGKPSTTDWKVAERFDGATLLHVFPMTGRRHQIRAHLYHIGHPILGDLRYGDRARQEQYPRLMLHALSLEFALPGGDSVTVEAPPPPSFEAVLAGLRARKKDKKEHP
jgi:tRNA pseudouridine32 synthase / 23S rRNA pseudouridine746 synthase